MEPTVGFEPTAYCLQNSCSTAELSRHFAYRSVWTILSNTNDVYIEHSEMVPRVGWTRLSVLRPLLPAGRQVVGYEPTVHLWCQGEDSNPRRHKATCFTDRPGWPLRYPGTKSVLAPINRGAESENIWAIVKLRTYVRFYFTDRCNWPLCHLGK